MHALEGVLATRSRRLGGLWIVGALLLGACAGAEEAGTTSEEAGARAPAAAMRLAPASDAVRTIQLYQGDRERALPILPLGGGPPLTLEFDLMARSGRPLSVYFYHADRSWRRDLVPAQYLTGFQRDDLLDYASSRGTEVPYVHYTYQFPNEDVGFRLSGNYVVRVTEQGQEDEVLFEKPFFVTEQAGPLDLGLRDLVVSGQAQPSLVPTARFTPPSSLQGQPFDYTVCFVRDADFNAPRCSARAQLAEQPRLVFDLPPGQAFAPAAADYFLDLSALRIGGEIEGTDFTVGGPPRVILEPDYARFAGAGLDSLLLGQPVVEAAVRDVPDPDLSAEYALVQFSFVPPEEQALGGGVYLMGSFGSGPTVPADTLAWVPERARYEGEVLIKQGRYEYRYASPDPRLGRVLERALTRQGSGYLAFVYYDDMGEGTDRLLAVRGARAY